MGGRDRHLPVDGVRTYADADGPRSSPAPPATKTRPSGSVTETCAMLVSTIEPTKPSSPSARSGMLNWKASTSGAGSGAGSGVGASITGVGSAVGAMVGSAGVEPPQAASSTAASRTDATTTCDQFSGCIQATATPNCRYQGIGFLSLKICSWRPTSKDHANCHTGTWKDRPRGSNSATSCLANLARICSKLLTVSFEYSRSPQRKQTSAHTFTVARLTPPRRSFSTSFLSQFAPTHRAPTQGLHQMVSWHASRANPPVARSTFKQSYHRGLRAGG